MSKQITIKLTEKQAANLVWALNIFEMSSEGVGEYDYALAKEYEQAIKSLAKIHAAAQEF